MFMFLFGRCEMHLERAWTGYWASCRSLRLFTHRGGGRFCLCLVAEGFQSSIRNVDVRLIRALELVKQVCDMVQWLHVVSH